MSLFGICQGDPIVKLLRSTFHATPLKIPEARIQPLGAIASYKKKDKWFGLITNLLDDTTSYPGKIEESAMASVKEAKSSAIDFDLGFKILSGFLQGFGLDGGAIKASFSGVTKVSFSFEQVSRHWVDIGLLGSFLAGKKFNKKNPASKLFFEEDALCLMVDSTIVSSDFRMNVEQHSTTEFKVDIPAIKEYIGTVKSSVKNVSGSELSISFTGENPLAFAFSTIGFYLGEDDEIMFKPYDETELAVKRALAPGYLRVATPDIVLPYKEPGMIEIDED